MNWMVPKNKLDKDQARIVNEILYSSDNYYVSGCPGTGKSVILAHVYNEYVSAKPNEQICILTYTHALIACIKDGLEREDLPIFTFNRFVTECRNKKWDLVLVDECQDMEERWANFIFAHAKRVILFGDFGQSIYDQRLNEKQLMGIFKPQVLMLNTIYRLTQNIKQLAEDVYPDLILKANIGRLVANSDIEAAHGTGTPMQFEYAIEKAKQLVAPQRPVGILLELNKSIYAFFHTVCPDLTEKFGLDDDLNELLRSRNSLFRYLGSGAGDLAESNTKPIVYVMSWHSSKGLDFENVVLPYVDRGSFLDKKLRKSGLPNAMYVAMTRARRDLFITYNKASDHRVRPILASSVVRSAEIKANGASAEREEPVQDLLF